MKYVCMYVFPSLNMAVSLTTYCVPTFIVVADNSTSKTNKKTPRSTKKVTIEKKCMVSIEPLIFDRDTGTSLKRRASRSVPDESAVTPKRTKGPHGIRKTKEQVMSPRQRYGMFFYILLLRIVHGW